MRLFEKEIGGLVRYLISEYLLVLNDLLNNVILPDLDVEEENGANMEKFEQFVKYIDGEDEQSQEPQCARKLLLPTPRYLTCKVKLLNSELWKCFSSVGTEMIITKSGR